MITPFVFSRTPSLVFGSGTLTQMGASILPYGKKILVLTGGASLKASGRWDRILALLRESGIDSYDRPIEGEPSPETVDALAAEFRSRDIRAVVSIGGGSVLDAGKAVSAMLLQEGPVMEYLEGVGTKSHDGRKVPFIAVPTTSGTGSEATKNAVLSRVGAGGFKKSLRHDNLIPDRVIIDPELTMDCPPHISASCGMDAFTQLLESYVSTSASPLTDALALSGIEYAARSLVPSVTGGRSDPGARAGMAYAAFLSGITLANAGLGIVHGLASPVGGFFPVPHGVACGTLMAPSMKRTIAALREHNDERHPALIKFARVGALVGGVPFNSGAVAALCDLLIEKLYEWTDSLSIPRLGGFGIKDSDIEHIVANTGNKNNAASLDKKTIGEIVQERL